MADIRYDRFRAEVLDLYRPPIRSANTLGKMRQVLDLFGSMPTVRTSSDLTPRNVARFVELCAGRSPNTIRGYLSYLAAACSYAVSRRYLFASPFDFRKEWIRRARPRARKHHPIEDIRRVLDFLRASSTSWEGGRLHALASLYAHTGLRRNEALLLRTEDLDIPSMIVEVPERAGTKTEGSAAPVPIPPPLVPVLAGWMGRCCSPWLFPYRALTGPWLSGSRGSRAGDQLAAAGRACGVEGFTPSSLRHSFATHAEAWGMSELMVQRILRHASASTQRHYRHADLFNLVHAASTVSFEPTTAPRFHPPAPAIAAGRPA